MPREIAWNIECEVIRVDPDKAREIRIDRIGSDKFFADQKSRLAAFRQQAVAEIDANQDA